MPIQFSDCDKILHTPPPPKKNIKLTQDSIFLSEIELPWANADSKTNARQLMTKNLSFSKCCLCNKMLFVHKILLKELGPENHFILFQSPSAQMNANLSDVKGGS